MKKLFIFLVLSTLSLSLFAESPESVGSNESPQDENCPKGNDSVVRTQPDLGDETTDEPTGDAAARK